MKKKRAPGRPTKLTPPVQRAILKVFEECGTIEDACAVAGVSVSAFCSWKAKGEQQKRGGYREFLEAVKQAEQQRRINREKRILSHGKDDWRAVAWMLERTEPGRYAPRVRVHVEEELNAAIARLREQLSPEEFERALRAIASDDRREGTGAPALGSGSRGSEADGAAEGGSTGAASAVVHEVDQAGEPEV